MEISGVRRVLAYTGEEKYQMLELNKRLETYLNHVKLLEEENHLLWGEIQALRRSQDSGGQRKAQVEALSRARREVQISWREKDSVELEICNLLEEVEELNALRQKERAAQAEAKRRFEESRKMLEDERRMQIWLREKAAHLERELSIQVKVHEEDMAALKSSLSISKPVLTAPQHRQTLNLQGLAEEYSQKAAQAWREASGMYQKQVEKLEESLKQSRAYMDQISQEKKESQLQLQALAKELENMKVKRELLERNMAKQRDTQNKEHHHFQAHIETLEAEKVDIEEQIGELLVDRRNLLQMKMSLGIEVATYRALLDNENLRANKQSPAQKTLRVLEGITKTHRTYPGTQTHLGISSCLLSSPLSTTSRSITSKPSLISQVPSWPLTRSTTQETPKKPKEEEILINKKTTNLQSSPATLAKPPTRAGSQVHYEPSDAHKDASNIAEDKPHSILSPTVKEDLFEALESGIGSQQVLSGSNETEVITSQTPDKEVSSSLHMDETKFSEDGDEEEIEVSAEMAQISHAPMSAWEETDTAIVDERDVVSELQPALENITENSTQEFRLDARQPEIKEFGKNTTTLLPSLSADALSPDEETSEMITWTDINESIIHFDGEESLKSSPENERELVEGNKDVDSTRVAEVFKIQDFDSEEHEEKNEDRKVEQRNEEEKINSTEQQSLIMEVTAVMDKNEKEVVAIINNSTEEFRLDAGFKECKQSSENTITLAPSLTEDTSLAAHTFSPDEKTCGIPTVADVNENIIHFAEEESLKSVPEIERESVEWTEDEKTSEILDVKESVIQFAEAKTLKGALESERESMEGTKEVDSTLTEMLKGHDFDSEEHEEKNQDREVEQRKEEEEINNTKQQSLITEATAVMDNNEKEVEAIINISTQEFRLDAGLTEYTQPGENIITLAPSLTEDSPLSAHTFSPDEETSGIPTWADVKENVIHFAEEESLKSAPETERESMEWTSEVDSTLTEVLKGQDFDSEESEEKNEDREVEQSKEEEEINSTEQQSLVMEETAVMDNNEKEVEAVINISTQEFRSDTGPTDFIQTGENIITSAPSLTEDTSLAAHTFSPDEETSGIPTWADVKENVIRFVEEESLKSAPETERKSVEQTTEVDSTLTEVLKGQDFDSEENEDRNEDREMEQRKEEEGTNVTEQQSLVMEATAVTDNNEKEVETIINISTQEFRLDAGLTEYKQPGENTITIAPPLTEDTPLSAHTFSPDEETSGIPAWADVKENVIRFVEEESLKSAPETERESVEQTTEVESTLTAVLKGQDFDSEEHEEKSEDREVEQRKEEEEINNTEHQSLVMKATAVMDNNEKEVEAVINISTQEFRLDTGPMDFIQTGENIITLDPSLTEDTPLAAHTFSPDEETSGIPTWEDVKENVIRFVEEESLKSAPETERESVEQTTEVESTLTEVLKGQDFDSEEHEEKSEDREVEQRKEEEGTIGTEEEKMIVEATAVMDINEKEVEVIINNSTEEFRLDAGFKECKQPSENTITLAPSLTEDTPLAAHTFSPVEKTCGIPTWADVKENIIHFAEEESLKSAPEVERESVEWTEDEKTSEILDVKESVIQFAEVKTLKGALETERESMEGTKEVDSTLTEMLKGHDFDSEGHEEKNQDREVEQRKEEEEINNTKQQSLITEATAVMDNNEKEVEAIINISTQEFRLDAGFTEYKPAGENIIKLAPSLPEDSPMSAHTFSPDEETSGIPTWEDVKENVIRFVEEESLKSAPETERESVEQTKEVESTLTEVLKGQDFDSEEHEEKSEDREVEQRKEEEGTNSTEHQSLVMEATAVMDNNEKEVEAIINVSTHEFRSDTGPTNFIQTGENIITLDPSLTEETPLAAHTFSPDEETSGIPTWEDVKENVIRFVEEESLRSAPEPKRESVEQTTEVESTLTEVLKGQDFDSEEHEDKSEDREVEQRKEEEGTIGTEEEKLIVEATAVMDINEKEVDVIINDSTQEFRLDAGLTDYKQPGENTITLAPLLLEDTPLSAQTFSPNEETNTILTWGDIKENVTRFVEGESLKRKPETQRESVERTENEETSEILDVKENVIQFVEEESLKSAPEIEKESVHWSKEVESTLTEVLKGQDFDSEEHEDINEDREVEQRKEEEGTNDTEQQSFVMELTAVTDNNEKEVEAIINNSTEEFHLDAGFTEYKQPGENTITLAPLLTEDTPLSAHTFSPDQETSEILDVKETVIHFDAEESLKSAPEFVRKSVEGAEDEETSEIPTWADIKENVIQFVEEESLKSAREIERESVEQTTVVDSILTEVLKGQDFHSEERKEKNEDREVEQRKENTITLAPPVTEDSPLAAHTFNPDEETREILTWADVKENVIRFVEEESLKSVPETKRESVEWTEDEKCSEILDVKESVIQFAEVETLKGAPETERELMEGTKEVDSTLAEVLKGQDFDLEEDEEKSEDREVEQRKEEEGTNTTEHQSLVMEATAVMDNNEKEVEAVINISTQEFRLDAGPTDFIQTGENTITLDPSLTEDTPLAAHTFSPDEETSGIPTWADVKENDIHFDEEESLKSAPETERESVEQTTEVDSTLTEVLKGQDFDSEEHEEKSEDREVEQRKEEAGTIGTEQEKLIVEVTTVMDNNEKEVEVIIDKNTQEFRLDAGLTVYKMPGENTITLAPLLVEDTPLSAHTFSPDEETTKILTWGDVKENVTRFVEGGSLKITPETERESGERTENEETSEILDVKESIIHFVEEESLKCASEIERESVEVTKEVDSTLTEVLKGQDFDSEEHEEKSKDREVEQRKEEEEINSTEQQSLVMEAAVMDNNEKEVEAIINNITQEFRLDAGLSEYKPPDENTLLATTTTITLAPLLTDTPLSTHSFSPDEQTSEILDVKETVIHFDAEESLKSAPEFMRKSVEGTEDEETSEIPTWADIKENIIQFVEEESLKSAREIERESVEQTTVVDSTLTEVLKGQDFDSEEHKEKNEDREVEQRKENTITLAPSLTDDTPLAAHTISPDEETSEILTWADVKENVIHFVEEESLKSAPKIERESVEMTEEVQENTESELPSTDMLKGQDFEEPEEKYQSDSEAKDRQSTGIKKEGLIEEVNAIVDKEKEATTQSLSVLQGDPDTISEYAEQKGMDTHSINRLLDEHHTEEEHGQSEDESLNISASWRTDPGEEYAQENTLADTRPLIHYKSEDETDADTKISHPGMTESNDSEGEGEKQEGDGHWSQKLTKRFDTMEDLSEEPEMCNVEDVVTYGSVHTVIEGYEEEVSEEYAQPVDEGLLQREAGDTDHGLMDTALVNHPQSELINNSEENSHGEEETMKENTLVVEKQEESSDFQDWSKGFPSETREVHEILPTEQSNNSEDDITKDNVENWESTGINPEQDAKAHFAYIPIVADIPVAEPPQEQTFEELTFETAMIKEQVCPIDEDEQSNLSLLTHPNLTDSFSQHSGLNSRSESYTADSEHEVSNSSDDESPNASRCSRILPHPDVPTQQVGWTTTSGGFLEKDSGSFTGLLKDEPRVGFAKDTQEYPHTEESETLGSQNKEEKQCTGSSGVDENAGSLLQTQEHDDVERVSHSILWTVQEHGVLKTENQDQADAFQGDDLKEESQTREKENDPQSFFSSGIKEGIWSTTQFEMAATFDPLDQTEAEKISHDSVHPNQRWGDLESLPSTNGKPENETGISLAQSVLEEREDQKIPQAKQIQCRDVRDEVVEAVHSGDSTDEGDSWSSGEE